MEPRDIQLASMDDMVFENRNKNYGAYILRKIYNKHVTISTAIASGLFVIFIATPYIIKAFGDAQNKEKLIDLSEVVLDQAPQQDKNEPPPPIVEPPPPLNSTVQFTPPVPVEDNKVTENRVVTVDDLEKVDAGPATVEGDPNGVDRSLDDSNKGPVEVDDNTIPTYVEIMPEFPGGEGALMAYVKKNIVYPQVALDNDIQGKVTVDFVVGKDGTIRDVKVVKGIGFGCDQEAVRVVSKMPAWTPGRQNGRNVAVSYKLPIKFSTR
ncbi:MAG: energy transducer TonB [Bacteroidetes bacterium]|nr:energy transducer TonB [Bacteroidota bacterium]